MPPKLEHDVRPSASAERASVRILVVEDERLDFVVLSRALERAETFDAEVVWCRTVEDARQHLDGSVDVALLDLGLPGASGLDALGVLRDAAVDVPVLVVTGSGCDDLGRAAIRAGAADFLQKHQISTAHVQRAIAFSLERHRRTRELEALAIRDDLTGLLNRRAFWRTLEHTRQTHEHRDGTFAVVYLDLDGFKEVNDTLGHAAGDALLTSFATALTRAVREGDRVARVGGDEFVCILECIEEPELVRSIASRLRAPAGGGRDAPCASAGWAVWSDDLQTLAALVDLAEERMRADKAARGAGR